MNAEGANLALWSPRRAALLAAFLVALVAGCDNPQPPASCGPVPERTISVGETATVSVCFSDPNEDLLTFVATSSDPDVATVANAANTVTVAAVSPGSAVVTVTATDPGGLTARQNFRVTVPNRPPATQGTIEDREVMVGDSVVLDVGGYFSEPDGQALSLAASSSDSTLVGAEASGTTLTAVALAKGAVVVTVTATDPGGLAANQRFHVTVPNRVPMAVDSISARIIEVDQTDTLDVSAYFADPDGDSLVYTVAASDSARAVPTVQGSVLTVTALAKGETRITVTATDNEGASAEQRFGVTVPNRPPEATDSLPDLELFRGDADTIALAMHFADPDGDSLSYTGIASDGGVVGLAVSAPDGTLTVTAVAQGGAEVTVTATDNEGASAEQRFRVTVPNRPPEATDSLPDLELFRREADTVALAMHFADPDGDTLSYTATTSDGDAVVAEVSMPDGTLTLTAVAQGGVEVTVTATDGAGASAEQSFGVTVPNRAPEATDSLPDLELFRGEADTIALAMHFADPDGDSLSYAATTSDGDAVAVAVSAPDGTLTVTAVAQGDAEITVTATDGAGASAEQSFGVTVPNRAPEATNTLPDRELFKGEADTIALAMHFADPDGDSLSYTAMTSDGDAVGVAVSVPDGTLTVTAVGQGAAEVTVTATDRAGASAEQSFGVTVPNRGPEATDSLPDLELFSGEADTIALAMHFADPDGDTLAYAATTSDGDAVAVAVSAPDGTLTVTAVAQGGAEVTVTATDNEGLSAEQSFEVTVRNRGPAATDSLPDLELFKGEADTIALAMHFADPDGDSLYYAATTSDGDAVAVAVSAPDGTLTVTAVAQGAAEITVTATDGAGTSAEQSFGVTVPNRAPGIDETLPSLTMSKRDTVQLDLAPYFFDPDGDRLGYAAESTNDSLAVASVQHGVLTIRTTAATGRVRITVTATDTGQLSAEQRFPVTVRNSAPVATVPIPDVTLTQGATHSINASRHFEDPDGDGLTYSATSSNTGAVRVGVAGSNVTVRAVARGQAEITIDATDPDEASADQSFTVTVRPPATSFDIAVGFAANVGSSVRDAVGSAASYWESALRSTEFEDIAADTTITCRGAELQVGTIDDVGIAIGLSDVDGSGGTLAWATLCGVRTQSRTPLLGLIAFDVGDVDRLAQSGNLRETAVHEIAHVLGIGLGQWYESGLLGNPSYADSTADTHFAGSRAIAAFNAAGGSGYTGAKVPVQNGGDDGHWRASVFGREVMTPTVVLGTTSPLSAITLQALADLGYRVDASYAQAYQLPAPAPGAAAVEGGEILHYGNDVLRGPVQVFDRNGKVVDAIGPEAAPREAVARIRAGPAIRVIIGDGR